MWHKTFHQLLVGSSSTRPWPNGSDERMQPCMGAHCDHTHVNWIAQQANALSPSYQSWAVYALCFIFYSYTWAVYSQCFSFCTHSQVLSHSLTEFYFLQSNTCQLNPSVSGCFLPVIPVLSLFTSRTVVYFWYNGLLLKFPEMCILVWRLLLSALMPVLSRVQLKW